MNVLISAGGSGGHINPALAIADYITSRNKNIHVTFAGTEKGLESKLVPREGYPIRFLKVRGFQRRITLKNVDAAIKAVTSQITAKRIIKDTAPDIVIGTGGHVCFPVLNVAAKMKIPTLIHESNAYPGITTKILSKSVSRVMISFEESRKYFAKQENIIYVGNPVKRAFFDVDAKSARAELSPGKPMILSFGGSLGAQKINESAIGFMDQYAKNKNINHYHATGGAGFSEMSKLFAGKGLPSYGNLHLAEYFHEIWKYMAAADIIVCRSGALTLSELAVLRKPAILIPSPYVTENHQYKNAEVLMKKNAAVIIEEKDLSAETLAAKIDSLLADPLRLTEMSRNIGRFATGDTLEKIYDEIMRLYQK
ncbi:UDP-N-acetylglucosamine--N-acetylmuramyl-(pentapeptide) pyrophosphoryl-undecaprenol N-acetylglucosamine transferase 1 [Clostridia bacterium]|nr:UDP-N-acetylglucosamine--N-acetylmuramyl-(pentapeptide) pyrophosphoryl-undecaprenol N-acetylglucosamine transferase 1 [Clostridia bacterium]